MKVEDPFKTVDSIAESIDMSDVTENDKVERESYSKHSYNKVKKLRSKGLLRGEEIPYLKYSVDSPEKPRTLFLVLGIISAIFLVLAIAFVTFFTVTNLIPIIQNLVGTTEQLTIRYEFDIFAVGPAFGTLTAVLMWAIVPIIVMAFVGIIWILVVLTNKMFAMSKVSIQEMAVGHEIKASIKTMIIAIIIVVSLMVGLFILVENMPTRAVLVVLGIGLGLIAICATILTFLLLEKKKANKKFQELPYEEQEDFMVHARALERASKRKKTKNMSDIGLGFDF